jgi:DNA helicase HerA-like ATPase
MRSQAPTPVTFQPRDFTYHAAFLGGTGSGKTTAALNLIEQLLARDIPVVMLDRKGDLCRYADPAAWERPLPDASRVLARQALRAKLDVAVFTPGELKGRPLALPVVPPGFDELAEADRERFAQYAAAALGSMIGFKSSDKDQGQRAILAKAIETVAGVPGATITVPALRSAIEDQDDALLNAIGGGYPDSYFRTLAQRLLTLELNNRQLLTGNDQLDVDALLGTGAHPKPGRIRLSVISTRFLGDAAKVDFWVSQLLVAISRWCARAPQPHLQAVFLFDEADVYLPATRQPATKAPMEDLLKRARSAGVGVFLATQSPGDFDYKCKENVGTWLIGRVREPRALEKLRPMLMAAKANVVDKLAGQATGDFYLVRESDVTAVRSNESFIRTEQLPENQIVALARASFDVGT